MSDRFPYSEPFGSINYIRNSVKVVTSAYDGSMKFYVVDPKEPIVAAYAKIFPALFAPMSEMPTNLNEHIRYPTNLFTVQAEVYRMYHMTNPTEYYNREDVWAWPEEVFADKTQRMEPYYVLMQLPGQQKLEFVQILPFTPSNRENMIAWMAAVSDPDRYGQEIVYEFGKDALYFGPKQVESRIDQDPTISGQLSLWNQQGSSVIRGNLLVIPIGGTLMYVEPLYLQAASGKIPELKRVIVATADRVEMANNLGVALVNLFGKQVLNDKGLNELATYGGKASVSEALTSAGSTTAAATGSATLQQIVTQANQQFEQAQKMAQQGDWAGYGDQIKALQSTLSRLSQITGAKVPTQTIPAASPTPQSTPGTGS